VARVPNIRLSNTQIATVQEELGDPDPLQLQGVHTALNADKGLNMLARLIGGEAVRGRCGAQ
jgi:hypothetical protein